ncbi:hypothetical protein Bhyg_09693 [Pseudolycoriella hygida]|uniref:Transposable element P transposase-like GTP-binding insertion domain-containing protein n=1 Tax=Pseudolycoriella hygida TaxID=35572 RepID=A0A9Q0MS08_9DIPT|nr:hypothetical protein Bhyg_09693 [Pseudolycoriella hygida]
MKKICKRHFLPGDYFIHANGSSRLKFDAVPSQNLPNPIWLEHNYMNRHLGEKPKVFKPAKIPKPRKAPKNTGQKSVSKITILELKKQLMMKDKTITSLSKKMRFKVRQIMQLRKKLKSSKMTKKNAMNFIEDVFAGNEEIIMFFDMQFKNGSVCDQAPNNVSTINSLMNSDSDTRCRANSGQLLSYKLSNATVIHCFDTPHLLKGTRNNLITKDLRHSVFNRWSSSNVDTNSSKRSKQLVASWKDVIEMYELHLKGNRRLLRKITPEHIKPEKQKMKVSVACQVFSQTYGKVMLECSDKEQLSYDCSGTAQILTFFNDFFDSLNGSSTKNDNELKSAVSENSVHFRFWDYALLMLSRMKFADKKTGQGTNRTKNVENWMSTIRGYQI